VAAALAMGARVVGQHSHRYTPIGVTVVVLLAESHLALHSFPEHGAATLDVFVCGSVADPARARAALARALGARRVVELAVGRRRPASAASARARARAGRGSRR
jgi:S-adenosylmethionine decarboxylase proenzyme